MWRWTFFIFVMELREICAQQNYNLRTWPAHVWNSFGLLEKKRRNESDLFKKWHFLHLHHTEDGSAAPAQACRSWCTPSSPAAGGGGHEGGTQDFHHGDSMFFVFLTENKIKSNTCLHFFSEEMLLQVEDKKKEKIKIPFEEEKIDI